MDSFLIRNTRLVRWCIAIYYIALVLVMGATDISQYIANTFIAILGSVFILAFFYTLSRLIGGKKLTKFRWRLFVFHIYCTVVMTGFATIYAWISFADTLDAFYLTGAAVFSSTVIGSYRIKLVRLIKTETQKAQGLP